jgi:hypothetical protein
MKHDTPWLAERIEPKLAELRYEVERLRDALWEIRSACALPAWDRAAYIAVADQGAYLEACAHAVGVTHGIVDRALGEPEPLPIPPDGPHLSARFSCLPEDLQAWVLREAAWGPHYDLWITGEEFEGTDCRSGYYWRGWMPSVRGRCRVEHSRYIQTEDRHEHTLIGATDDPLEAAEIIAAHMWATQEATQ